MKRGKKSLQAPSAFLQRRRYQRLRAVVLVFGVLLVVWFFIVSIKSVEVIEKQQLRLSALEKQLQSNVGRVASKIGKRRNNHETKGESNNNNNNNRHEDYFTFTDRYILFRKLGYGQGAGNVMNGLLAAHLFGQEFNRTVCVEEGYHEFHAAFEAINPHVVRHCPEITNGGGPKVDARNHVRLINFYSDPVDECDLKNKLASGTKVIEYLGNTYPRWPHVEKDFFFRHYRARQELLDILPHGHEQQSPPSTVVHLRAPDPGGADRRKGLDEHSLVALGEALPRNETFLVTNQVDWFKRFEEGYGWSHSNWDSISHSGSGSVPWKGGGDGRGLLKGRISRKKPIKHKGHYLSGLTQAPTAAPVDHSLQMWADYYMMLTAKKMYHTNSDFSNSAVHWMDIDAFVIEGYSTRSGSLILKRESWLVDGESPALLNRRIERKGPDSENIQQLRGCLAESLSANHTSTSHKKHGQVLPHHAKHVHNEKREHTKTTFQEEKGRHPAKKLTGIPQTRHNEVIHDIRKKNPEEKILKARRHIKDEKHA